MPKDPTNGGGVGWGRGESNGGDFTGLMKVKSRGGGGERTETRGCLRRKRGVKLLRIATLSIGRGEAFTLLRRPHRGLQRAGVNISLCGSGDAVIVTTFSYKNLT